MLLLEPLDKVHYVLELGLSGISDVFYIRPLLDHNNRQCQAGREMLLIERGKVVQAVSG